MLSRAYITLESKIDSFIKVLPSIVRKECCVLTGVALAAVIVDSTLASFRYLHELFGMDFVGICGSVLLAGATASSTIQFGDCCKNIYREIKDNDGGLSLTLKVTKFAITAQIFAIISMTLVVGLMTHINEKGRGAADVLSNQNISN